MTKAKTSALVDTRVVWCGNAQFRAIGCVIIPLTVKDIPGEHLARKLA